jgi:hypothetical protein
MRVRPKLTYANVMVTLLAFVVFAGGGAYAASKLSKNSVGSKQIQRDAVTSPKVKNGSLKPADLAAGALAQASHGFQANGSVNYDVFSSSPFGSTVVTLDVPPGSYLATASVEPQTVNAVASTVTCRLINEGGALSTPTTRTQVVRADTEPENFTLTSLFEVTAGQTLALECSKNTPSSSARIVTANIVAVSIGDVSGTSD